MHCLFTNVDIKNVLDIIIFCAWDVCEILCAQMYTPVYYIFHRLRLRLTTYRKAKLLWLLKFGINPVLLNHVYFLRLKTRFL